MRRKIAGYSLLSVYAFCFFTVVFHTVAHAQTTTEIKSPVTKVADKAQVLAASTKAEDALIQPPTPTMYVSSFVEPQTLPSITPTTTPEPTPPTARLANGGKIPTPTAEPTKASIDPPTAAPQSTANPSGLSAEKLFSMSNDYRATRGLPALQKDDRVCSLAASRAPEIDAEVASGSLHAGLAARALPYWNTENIISMSSEEAAFNWWINDPIHHQAIVGNFTYSCVACSDNSCAQEFTNFQPK